MCDWRVGDSGLGLISPNISACEAKEGPSGAVAQLVEQVVELGAKGGGEAERCGSLRQPVLEDVPVQHTRHVRRTGPREGRKQSVAFCTRAARSKLRSLLFLLGQKKRDCILIVYSTTHHM